MVYTLAEHACVYGCCVCCVSCLCMSCACALSVKLLFTVLQVDHKWYVCPVLDW